MKTKIRNILTKIDTKRKNSEGRRYYPAAGGRDGNELERKVNRIEQCNEGSAL